MLNWFTKINVHCWQNKSNIRKIIFDGLEKNTLILRIEELNNTVDDQEWQGHSFFELRLEFIECLYI